MSRLSRRALLLGASTLPLASASKAESQRRASGSGSDGGRVCLGLNGITYYNGFYAFLNIWKQGQGDIKIHVNGVEYSSSAPRGEPNSPWGVFLDDNGDLVKPLPSRGVSLTRIVHVPSSVEPEFFSRAGEPWVCKWQGAAASVSVVGATQRQVGNRLEWTWPAAQAPIAVKFSDISQADPPRNIRICKVQHEKMLDAGEMFDPAWIKVTREGAGIVRFMDWQATNNNRAIRSYLDFPSEGYMKWGGDGNVPSTKSGVPLTVISRLANQVQSHPWVCIPVLLGTSKYAAVSNATNAGTSVFTAKNHKFEDGDKVIPYSYYLSPTWATIARNTYTVANVDKTRHTLELKGVDSTGFTPFKGALYLTSVCDIGNITREIVPFAKHFKDTIDSRLTTYFEFGNETWSAQFDAMHWLAAQSRGRFKTDSQHWMGGYLAAHCMRIILETYGAGDRARWRGVIPTLTILPYATNEYITGIKAYLAEHVLSLTVRDLFDVIAVTGYWGGQLYSPANKKAIFDWMSESEERWKAGQESTKHAYFNRVVNEELSDGRRSLIPAWDRVKSAKDNWLKQKSIADQYGLELVQYEGGNHSDLNRLYSVLSEQEKQRLLEFWYKANHTKEDAANYSDMFDSFTSIGGKYPAKFVEMSAPSRYGAWGGLRWLGDRNPVWDAVVAFNNRS